MDSGLDGHRLGSQHGNFWTLFAEHHTDRCNGRQLKMKWMHECLCEHCLLGAWFSCVRHHFFVCSTCGMQQFSRVETGGKLHGTLCSVLIFLVPIACLLRLMRGT